jgi:hypothetical protein
LQTVSESAHGIGPFVRFSDSPKRPASLLELTHSGRLT